MKNLAAKFKVSSTDKHSYRCMCYVQYFAIFLNSVSFFNLPFKNISPIGFLDVLSAKQSSKVVFPEPY